MALGGKNPVFDQIREVVDYLQLRLPQKPEMALVLGSGLGNFSHHIEKQIIIPYSEIPHFQKTTVEGHEGRIVFGYVDGIAIVALQGRWHFYEGYSMNSIVLPTRALGMLGAHTLFLTNAAGGINLNFKAGDLMIIEDQINLMGDNPLTGKESTQFGPRFPDMTETYCRSCIQIIEKAGKKIGSNLRKGIYAGLRGPTYETPAEVRMLRILGADAVGMSTVPEAIAARHMGMRVVGMSCITNMAAGIDEKILDHGDIKATAHKVIEEFSQLLKLSIPEICRSLQK